MKIQYFVLTISLTLVIGTIQVTYAQDSNNKSPTTANTNTMPPSSPSGTAAVNSAVQKNSDMAVIQNAQSINPQVAPKTLPPITHTTNNDGSTTTHFPGGIDIIHSPGGVDISVNTSVDKNGNPVFVQTITDQITGGVLSIYTVTMKINADGSMTITITGKGQDGVVTDTHVVTTKPDGSLVSKVQTVSLPGGGEITTTVTMVNGLPVAIAVTTDKDGKITEEKTVTTNPDGSLTIKTIDKADKILTVENCDSTGTVCELVESTTFPPPSA